MPGAGPLKTGCSEVLAAAALLQASDQRLRRCKASDQRLDRMGPTAIDAVEGLCVMLDQARAAIRDKMGE